MLEGATREEVKDENISRKMIAYSRWISHHFWIFLKRQEHYALIRTDFVLIDLTLVSISKLFVICSLWSRGRCFQSVGRSHEVLEEFGVT